MMETKNIIIVYVNDESRLHSLVGGFAKVLPHFVCQSQNETRLILQLKKLHDLLFGAASHLCMPFLATST